MQHWIKQRATENGDIGFQTPAIDVSGQALLVTEIIVYNLAGSALDIAIQIQSSNDLQTWTNLAAAGSDNLAAVGATSLGTPATSGLYGRYIRYAVTISGTTSSIQYSIVLNTFPST